MSLARWTRIAAICLIVGGCGSLEKYVLLAIFDPDGTSTSATLQTVTVVGLLLSEVLLPLGATALPALWLRGRPWWMVAVSFALAAILFFAVPNLALAALGSPEPFGTGDPWRLRTEGGLAAMGILGVATGILVLRSNKTRLAAEAGAQTPPRYAEGCG